MLYIHESNIQNKINSNYGGLVEELTAFYNDEYIPMRNEMRRLLFMDGSLETFEEAAAILNRYYDTALDFQRHYRIDTRSKFLSTIYEELSVYLFRDHPLITSGVMDVYNKGIYAGLRFVNANDIAIITKDVDFCIGKRVDVVIDDTNHTHLILPVVCVEVKTYLDATMFGEVKSSSGAIRSATPNSKAYVLMGHKELADEHIIAARQESTLSEMFVLRRDKESPIDPMVLFDYWNEITDALDSISDYADIQTPGRLLFPNNVAR